MERKSSCFLSKVFIPLQKLFRIHCEKKKSLRIRGEVLPGSHCDCFPSTYTDITLKDRQAGGAKNNMKPAKLTESKQGILLLI